MYYPRAKSGAIFASKLRRLFAFNPSTSGTLVDPPACFFIWKALSLFQPFGAILLAEESEKTLPTDFYPSIVYFNDLFTLRARAHTRSFSRDAAAPRRGITTRSLPLSRGTPLIQLSAECPIDEPRVINPFASKIFHLDAAAFRPVLHVHFFRYKKMFNTFSRRAKPSFLYTFFNPPSQLVMYRFFFVFFFLKKVSLGFVKFF